MRTVPDLGVYIHFPYCRKLCPYCDFAVAVAHPEPPHEVYLAAVLAELAARAPAVLAGGAPALRSIYFGGGTPSWWRPDCLAAVVEAVITTLAPGTRAAALEITLEANPSDCTPASLAGWRAAGINRVSIGVQSLDDGELRVLGRDHRHGDGAAAIAAARAAGLRSVSGDAILGAPRPGRATSPAPALADLGCDHVSAYELTIEARTAFGKRTAAGRMVPRDEDELAALYLATDEAMRARGFEHYEIRRTRGPATAPSTTACTGAAATSSAWAPAPPRSCRRPTRPTAVACVPSTPGARAPTWRRRPRPGASTGTSRPPRSRATACGWACAPATASTPPWWARPGPTPPWPAWPRPGWSSSRGGGGDRRCAASCSPTRSPAASSPAEPGLAAAGAGRPEAWAGLYGIVPRR